VELDGVRGIRQQRPFHGASVERAGQLLRDRSASALWGQEEQQQYQMQHRQQSRSCAE
jgi:hypothetical protein